MSEQEHVSRRHVGDKKRIEQEELAKKNAAVEESWYEIKDGKKVVQVLQKKNGNRFNRFLGMTHKPEVREFIKLNHEKFRHSDVRQYLK